MSALKAFSDEPNRVKLGPASDPNSEMGPLIDKPNLSRVNKMVAGWFLSDAQISASIGLMKADA